MLRITSGKFAAPEMSNGFRFKIYKSLWRRYVVKILCFWILSNLLSLSKNTVLFIRSMFCNIKRTMFFDKDRTMDNFQKHNIWAFLFVCGKKQRCSEPFFIRPKLVVPWSTCTLKLHGDYTRSRLQLFSILAPNSAIPFQFSKDFAVVKTIHEDKNSNL
jgi:hypothetical protein